MMETISPDPTTGQRAARAAGRIACRALGAVLCVAAVLKAVIAFSAPLAGLDTMLALAGSSVEVVIGAALILGFRPSVSLPAAALLFVMLAGASSIGTVRGVASCGCFGTLAVPPWVTLIFDTGAAIVLLWGARTFDIVKQRRTIVLTAGCIVSALMGMAVGSAIYPRLGAVTSMHSPEAVLAADTVIIDPSTLRSGQPFPLLPYIRIDADLSEGDWKIIIARAACRKCERRLRGGECEPEGDERVAVVLAEEKKGWVLSKECEAIVGVLSPDKIWSFEAPLTVWLKDGRFLKAR
jgi:hypothetical protein